jgi:hypothetical protein
VEWWRVYARSRRFDEEVRLVREEMRRTVAYGDTAAEKWDALACEALPDAEPELTEGRQAYAAEQADRERETCALLRRNWTSILAKARAYLDGEGIADATDVTIEVDLGDELDPEDEEAWLEGEEEEEEG